MSNIRISRPPGPLIVGLGGFFVLAALGVWQVQRLDWKRGLIAEAERRVAAAPVALPGAPDPERDDYLPVRVRGRYDHDEAVFYLTSLTPYGPGFEVVTPLETPEGRRILVNRGFVPQDARSALPREGAETVTVEGVLRWPDDRNSFTPEPDAGRREWYARDVAAMADATGSEPVMILRAPASNDTGWPRAAAAQVRMTNDHLQYALTWFALAAVWVGMSALWYRRMR